MDIIVKTGCIIYKKKNHLPGATVQGVDDKEADRLIAKGKAAPAEEKTDKTAGKKTAGKKDAAKKDA